MPRSNLRCESCRKTTRPCRSSCSRIGTSCEPCHAGLWYWLDPCRTLKSPSCPPASQQPEPPARPIERPELLVREPAPSSARKRLPFRGRARLRLRLHISSLNSFLWAAKMNRRDTQPCRFCHAPEPAESRRAAHFRASQVLVLRRVRVAGRLADHVTAAGAVRPIFPGAPGCRRGWQVALALCARGDFAL